MTENEALKIATHCLGVQAEQEVCEECPVYIESGIVCKEIARTAISALKEVQQYRKIGTVEECRKAVEKQVNRMSEICDKCLTCHWYCDDVLEECKGQEEPCHEYSPCMEIRRVGELNETD